MLPIRCQNCRLRPSDPGESCAFEKGRVEAGGEIFAEGSVPDAIVYVRRGRVVLTSSVGAGRESWAAVRGTNAMLGLEGLFEQPLPYSVRALSDVNLCHLPVAGFKEWVGPLDSPLGLTLRHSVEEGARRASERRALEGTAVRRIARFLAEAVDRGEDAGSLDVPHGVLAGVLGMRTETLSRALTELREAGAIERRRGIRIRDLDALRRIASE